MDSCKENAKFVLDVYGEEFGQKYLEDSIADTEGHVHEYWLEVQKEFNELIKAKYSK